MSWRGVFAGTLGLIALQAVVGSSTASGRIGGLLGGIGNITRAFLSPAVPAIPDLTTKE